MLNFAKESQKVLVERFKIGSVTNGLFTAKYRWMPGFKQIEVRTIDDLPLQKYDMTKLDGSRFGPSIEVGDRIQVMDVNEDWAYNGTIDKRNNTTTLLSKAAGRIVTRQADRVITPFLDKFYLQRLCDERGLTQYMGADLSKENVIEKLMEAQAMQTNALVPNKNKVCYISATENLKLKLSTLVLASDKISDGPIVNNEFGKAAGLHMVEVPDEYMPTITRDSTDYAVKFFIIQKGLAVAPKLITTSRVITEDPDIDGSRIQMRMFFDCHVINEWNKGILAAVNDSDPNAESSFKVVVPADSTVIESGSYKASDFQHDVQVFDDRVIVGFIKPNATAATSLGFSGKYVLCLNVEGVSGATLKARIVGGPSSGNWATLDSTGAVEFCLDDLGDPAIYEQSIEITCEKGGVTHKKVLSLNGLHLET